LLGKGCLAPLTGQDAKALDAIVACWKLYAISDEAGQRVALASVTLLLHGMQEKTRWLARELIPFVFDWTDRERLWSLVTGDLRAVLSAKTKRRASSEQPEGVEQPEAHRDDDNDVQNGFDLRLHRNHRIHEPEQKSDDDKGDEKSDEGHAWKGGIT